MKLYFQKACYTRGTLKCKYNTRNKRVIIFNVQQKWLPKLDPRQEKKLRSTSVAVFLIFFFRCTDLSEFIYSQFIHLFYDRSIQNPKKKTQAAFRSGTGQMELYNKKNVTIKRSVDEIMYFIVRNGKKEGTGPTNNKKKLVLQYFNRFFFIRKCELNFSCVIFIKHGLV